MRGVVRLISSATARRRTPARAETELRVFWLNTLNPVISPGNRSACTEHGRTSHRQRGPAAFARVVLPRPGRSSSSAASRPGGSQHHLDYGWLAAYAPIQDACSHPAALLRPVQENESRSNFTCFTKHFDHVVVARRRGRSTAAEGCKGPSPCGSSIRRNIPEQNACNYRAAV